MSETKLIIEDGIEIKGQEIVPKMRVWIGRDSEGICAFPDKPIYRGSKLQLFLSGKLNQVIGLPSWIATLEIELGECAEYEITFKRVDK